MPTLWSVLTLVLAVWIPLTVCNSDEPIMLTPSSLTVEEGENANFTCTPLLFLAGSLINTIDPITGEDIALTITNPRLEVKDLPEGNATRRVFIWLNVTLLDHGRRFFCHFSNERSNESTLYVIHPLTASIDQTSFTATEGDQLVVPLNISGHPINLSLTHDGNTVDNGGQISLNTTSLSFTVIMREDAGAYVLTVSNDTFTVYLRFTISVRFAPEFLSADEVRVLRDDQLMIDCSATAYPDDIEIKLFRDGNELMLGEDNIYTSTATDSEDEGVYKCVAVNEVGTTEHNITVIVTAPPGPVDDIKFNFDANKTKIVITWVPAETDDPRFPVIYIITIEYEDKTYMTNTNSTSIEVSRDDLDIPKDQVEIKFTISVTAVSEIGRGEPATEVAALGSSSSSKKMAAQQLFSLLLLCTVLLMLA